jgi:hypothetical protein
MRNTSSAMIEVAVMKRMLSILFSLVVIGAIWVRPIPAEESGVNDYGLSEQKGYTDECLLVAINCGNDFHSLEQKIDKLRNEIAKGRSVYTDDELRILREQLTNADKTLEFFKKEGGGDWYKYPGE